MTLPRITDIRQMFPSEYFNHTDLIGPDGKFRKLTLAIDHCDYAETVMDGGAKAMRYVLHFQPKRGYQAKPLVLNSTNKMAVISVCPPDKKLPQSWGGVEVELFVATDVRSPAKWRPIYGAKMPGIRIRARSSRGEEMKDELRSQLQKEAPPVFDDDVPPADDPKDDDNDGREPGQEG